jgi:hypothetical protein
MHETNPFLIFTTRLHAIGVRYMITGSVAATFYGEPRLTNDVDIVAVISGEQAPALGDAFPLSEFYLPPEEVIRVESARALRGHFNIIHHSTGYKADIYLAGQDGLHQWGLGHVRKVEIDGVFITLAPPEYVIVRKLEFFREGNSEKHIKDIRAIIDGVSQGIDHAVIDTFVSERGLSDIWNSAKSRGFFP